MKIINETIFKIMRSFGYGRIDPRYSLEKYAVELNKNEIEIIQYVLKEGYTMTTIPRLVNTLKSCKYVVENKIPGDFVECGVWRGGNSILAKKIFEAMGSDKKVWMFDTFEGMTEPSEIDKKFYNNISAKINYKKTLGNSHSNWCYASMEDVKKNFETSLLDMSLVKFIKGDVCKTLTKNENLPEEISVLRLDTDWYESTKVELEVLFPLLSMRGVLIVDDYGSWIGSRKAVDEYFSKQHYKPLLNIVDHTGRTALKA